MLPTKRFFTLLLSLACPTCYCSRAWTGSEELLADGTLATQHGAMFRLYRTVKSISYRQGPFTLSVRLDGDAERHTPRLSCHVEHSETGWRCPPRLGESAPIARATSTSSKPRPLDLQQ